MHQGVRCLVALTGLLISPVAIAAPLQIVVPRTTQSPTLDGVLVAGEWDDAAATTGLISQFGKVAHPRQAIFWIKYDAKNIYIAHRSTCFPEEHASAMPQTWLDRDSSIVVGLDPARLGRGSQPSHFLLRSNVNKQLIGKEIFWELEGVKITYPHPAWNSGATIEQKFENNFWTSEMSLPLENLKAADLKDGEEWGLLLGRDYSAADQCALTLSTDWRFGDGNRHYGRAFFNNYRLEKEYARMKLGGTAPAVQLINLGDVLGGHPTPTVTVKNTTSAPIRVVVRQEWRIAYGAGNQNPPQEYTLDLQPGEQKQHTFKTIDLPQGEIHACQITVTGPGGTLLAQEIPVKPGWGDDRNVAIAEPYYSGNHFGGRLAETFLLSTGYDPILNRIYCRTKPGELPNGHLIKRGELTLRRAEHAAPVVTMPLKGKLPEYWIMMHDLNWWREKGATVLEWVSPADGVVDVEMAGSHQFVPTESDGEAIQILHFGKAANTVNTVVPRTVTKTPYEWVPLEAKGIAVKQGDKLHFYYDHNGNEGFDNFALRGTVSLTTADGTKKVYNPGGEWSAGAQGGTTGVWSYRFDMDAKPNVDGNYAELAWGKIPQTSTFAWGEYTKEQPDLQFALINRQIVDGTWITDEQLPSLSPGVYEATVSFLGGDDRVLGRSRQMFIRYDHREDLPWLFEKVGASTKVLPPWTPIRTKQEAVVRTIECWGRSYQIGADGLISGIVNQGDAQLPSPVHIEVLKDGQPIAMTADGGVKEFQSADHEATYTGSQKGAGLEITTEGRIEYDGYLQHTIKLDPAQVPTAIDSVRLVIPLKPEDATHLHAAGGEFFRKSVASLKLGAEVGQLWHSGRQYGGGAEPMKEPFGQQLMTVGNFRPYVWIGNADRGIDFMADNDSGWVPDDSGKVPAIEVVREEGAVNLVLNLVARPFTFAKVREITFSLQATPIRTLPDDMRARRNHLSMATAFPGLRDEKTGWAWTGQMYSIADDTASGKRSWLFGDPGSAPYPLNWDMSTWYREACENKTYHGESYVGTPYQSQLNVMTFPEVDDPRMPAGKQVSDVYGYIYPHIAHGNLEDGTPNMTAPDRDYRLWCYRNWIKHVGLKGMYFDQTQPQLAANPKAGMGYVIDLPDRPNLHGKVQPGYGVTGMRDFYKRLRTLFVESGVDYPYIWLHSTDANMVSAFAFGEYLLEGENGPYVSRKMPICEKISPTRMQAMRSSAGGIGYTQLEMIDPEAFADPLVWRDISGWFMLHDAGQGGTVYYLHNWTGLDLNRQADFLPYWTPKVAAALKSTVPEVYASAWRQDNALRVLVFNRNAAPVDQATIQIDLAALGLNATAGKQFVVTELEPVAKPEVRGAGELKADVQGNQITVTVPVMKRNFRLFKVTQP